MLPFLSQTWHTANDRRSFIRNAFLAVGVAGAPFPAQSLFAKPAAKSARYFSPARFAALDAWCETIMPRTDTPGARDVFVPARIDKMMRIWASSTTQTDFTKLIDEIDAAALAQMQMPLAKLSADQQLKVVSGFDRAKFRDPAYGKFKALVFAFYYLSESGATQELRYEHVPGAWEPSIPVTADTRGWAFDIGI